MKKNTLLILLMVFIAKGAISQTATGVVTQVPCNNDGIFAVTTTGMTLPITYTYYNGNQTIVHANVNSTTDQLTNFGMSNNGWISCQVSSSSGGAWVSDSYTPPFTFTISGSSPTCPATMGTLTASHTGGTTGPFTYLWTNDQSLLTYTGNNVSVPIGSYSATITDQTSGCVLDVTDSAATVQQLSNVTAAISTTDASCTNGTATAVASGGVAPYTYFWINGSTNSTVTGLSQGFHLLTVTDAIGCQSNNLGAFIQQNPQISVNTTVTNATCLQTDGSAIAFGSGGVPPYTYAWSNGQTGNTATNLSGPSWNTVIATDANGCFGQANALVNSSTPITVTYTETPSLCTSATGSATLSATGGTPPYTYVWNTFPATSGATLSNVGPGTYSFEVTDAVGCVRTGSAVISPISTITASAQGSSVICPNTTGTVATTVSGSNPPFSYLWSNGATTSQISGVALGNYSCVITDAMSCSVTKDGDVIGVSPLNLSVSTTPVSCVFNTDGAATTTVTGGTAPYTYSYTSGGTTPTATGLGIGNHWVTVTDANGCTGSQFFTIGNANTTTSCYCTISGNVYLDASADCVFDTGELGIQNIMVHCSGQGYTFTDANGYYSFQVPTGTYTVSEQINAYYPLTSCQNNDISVSVVAAAGCNTVVDFANDMNTINDLKILTMNSTLPPIPGNNYQQKVVVQNNGTVNETAIDLGYEHDGQLTFANSNLPSLVQLNAGVSPNNYSATSFPTLAPNAASVVLLNYNTPTNIPIGTVVDFYDSVAHATPIATNWLLDYTPWNNVQLYQPTVIGSYDPNYKEVYPKGIGAPGYIASTTTEFDYTIHFQNEGTYFAQNIYITDQLDSDLDWTTLRPGYSDYSYTTTVSETGLVTFTFANINLPWKSQYGDALSSGLINYSIDRLATNPQGTEFTNTADIFFDYNAPITTNTTLNTLDDEMAGIEEKEDVDSFVDGITVDLYPVPTNENITIRINNLSKDEFATMSIIDLTGKVILSEQIALYEGSTLVNKNISNLENGTYLTRIQFENGTFVVKKIVFSK